jgi:hypothetical protein
MTLEQFRRRLKKWQKRVGLQDWGITGLICPTSDLDPDTWANADWFADGESATIWVSEETPDEHVDFWIVHELVHILLDGDGECPEYDVHHEVRINKITKAIIPSTTRWPDAIGR